MRFYTVIVISFLSFCVQAKTVQNKLPVASYKITINSGYNKLRIITGQVIKQQEAKLGFEFAGKVNDIYAEQGDWVTKGQVLAEQDTRLVLADKAQVLARIVRTRAQLKLAEIELKRTQGLSKNNYSAAQKLDEIQTRIAVLNAELDVQQAQLDAIKIKLSKTKLRAPFNGILNTRNVAVGEITNPQTSLFTLLKQHSSQVQIGVPTNLINSINETMKIEIMGRIYEGKLLNKGGAINPVSRTLAVRFSLPNGSNVLSGALATIKVETFIDLSGAWIPLTALTDGPRGTWLVYVINKAGEIEPSFVHVHFSDGRYAYVSSQLEDGVSIIANGLHKLAPHIKVEVVDSVKNRSL